MAKIKKIKKEEELDNKSMKKIKGARATHQPMMMAAKSCSCNCTSSGTWTCNKGTWSDGNKKG